MNLVVVATGTAALAGLAGYETLNNLRSWADGVAAANGFPDDGNGGGAFRHSLVSAEITRLYGSEIAKQLGDLNEYAKPANYDPKNATDRNQDLWNNKVGRDIGKTSTSEQDSIQKVKDATNESVSHPNTGPLVIDHKTDPRVRQDNFPPDLLPLPFKNGNTGFAPGFGPFTDPNKPYKSPADKNGNGIPDIHESKLTPRAHKHYNDAKKFTPRRDPLTFDLDGDGLETVGLSATNPIMFDYDGDGIKNGTGWVKPDDAFLVRDVNGNGTIDSGKEMFGDSTIKSNGQKAVDGFDALADLDSNADGVINSSDSAFASLKLWRDLNQDGISQSNELFTLASQNIAGIKVAKNANNQTLADGNQLADTGSFIKTDGSTGTVGEVTGNLGDINLVGDTFNRTFPDTLDTSTVSTLPDNQAATRLLRRRLTRVAMLSVSGRSQLQGSGALRDLREAATQSTTLKNLLAQYSAATNREAQMALLDQLFVTKISQNAVSGISTVANFPEAANDNNWRIVG